MNLFIAAVNLITLARAHSMQEIGNNVIYISEVCKFIKDHMTKKTELKNYPEQL